MISRRVEELFEACSRLPEAERDAFLDSSCGSDEGLRNAVTSLLTAADGAEGFFSTLSERLGLRSVFDGDLELPRTRTIGAYRLVRLIGRGGMGAVFLAERADEQFDKQVALKVLPIGAGGDASRRRFLAERQILAQLVHPHIARLLDGGITDDGTPYFVMDYVDGVPIDAYCDKNRLGTDERLKLFVQVAEAVEYAHRNLIVHRDIKPGNVLVEASGDVKLVDFGVAKLLVPEADDMPLTRVAGRPMTLMYASPESIRGEPVTTAADIYSLGVLLYVLLTGRYPYPIDGAGGTDTQRLICEHDAIPPSRSVLDETRDAGRDFAARCSTTPRALAQRLKGDLDTIISMALRKDPDRRYRTVEQLIADLRRYEQGLPVIAQAPSVAYRLGKFVRRHRTGVAAAVTVAIALLGVAGLATYNAITTAEQARQIAIERDKAEQIKDFLLSMFELSGPSETKGETITARELIDRSAERIRLELSDQPERQAVLLHSIAGVYSELSLFEKAKPLLEDAMRIHLETTGELNVDYANATDLLAEIREIEGAYDEAERLVRDVVRIRRALDQPQELAGILLKLGRIQHKKGLLDEAEARYREALAMLREHGDSDEMVANGSSYLGSLLHHRDQLEAAESLHREALATRRALFGEEHIILIESYYNVGIVLMDRGQFDDAVRHLRAALDITQKLLPDGDQGAVFLYNGLGRVLERQGELEQARINYRQSLDLILRFFGEGHPNAGIVMGNLGRVLLELGDHEQAEPLLRSGVATVSTALPNHRLLPGMRLTLGRHLMDTARYEEAERILRDSHAGLERTHGQDNDDTQAAIRSLIELYEVWDRPASAEALRGQLVGRVDDP